MIVNEKKNQALILGKTEHNFCFPINNIHGKITCTSPQGECNFVLFCSLFIRRLQNFMITLYKSMFFTNYPGFFLKDMFTIRSSSYNLRGNHIMSLRNPKTTTYGLHSFSYLASKIWNSLPDTYRTLNFLEFKQEILRYEAFPQQIYKLYCMHNVVYSLKVILFIVYK